MANRATICAAVPVKGERWQDLRCTTTCRYPWIAQHSRAGMLLLSRGIVRVIMWLIISGHAGAGMTRIRQPSDLTRFLCHFGRRILKAPLPGDADELAEPLPESKSRWRRGGAPAVYSAAPIPRRSSNVRLGRRGGRAGRL